MRRGQALRLAAAICAVALCGGCGLLPEEAEAPSPPLIRSYERTDYTLAVCERGDVVATQKTTFKYSPARKEQLAFAADGAALAGVYVSTGEFVEEGALLAELEDGGLADGIEQSRERIAGYEDELERIARDEELELRACDLRIAAAPENESLAKAKSDAAARFSSERKTAELRLEAERTRLDELKENLEKRRIYAPFSGTITYIKSFGADGYSSVAGEAFITISDKTALVFMAEGSSACALFSVGDEVEMSVDGVSYPASIVENDGARVRLEPSEYIAGVGEGSYGSVVVVTGAAYGVLRVPSSAVKSANGQAIVYTLVDGVRTLREVEAGFSADGYTEIISGLGEGEQVISE